MRRSTLFLLVLALIACQSQEMRESKELAKEEAPAEEAKPATRHRASSAQPAPGLLTDFDVEIAQAAAVGQAAADEIVVIGRSKEKGTAPDAPRGGELRVRSGEREIPLPLEHTDVKAEITLHVASVRVTQKYSNPYSEKIEAVYVFPLPQNAAVTDFLMRIGDRTIRGIIREREEAERIYKAARRQGYVASLLTQERPNVFTQSVANIEPGRRIDIEIAYFHTLRHEDGEYVFHFPMVVGPRFNPPGTTDGVGAAPRGGRGASGQSTEVEYLRPDEVSPHMISLEVDLAAGLPVEALASPSHTIDATTDGDRARIRLDEAEGIPNRDFVLRYRVAADEVRGAMAVHEGYFTLMLQPPRHIADTPDLAREMVFVVDCSGSMRGEPLATCKRAMRRCLKRLRRNDTFQIIRFSDSASALGEKPLPATPDNLRRGRRYLDRLGADGGTMMVRGIRAALGAPRDPERYRIVSFMTDGFIGNEREILAEVHRSIGDARIFSFGVGNSVNRYLLERMASAGRGVATYVTTDESSERAVDALYRRIESPALTDLRIDWGTRVTALQPAPLPDLFVGRPIVVTGRCEETPRTVRVRGRVGRETVEIEVPVRAMRHEAIGKLWARARIASLNDSVDAGADAAETASEIRTLALEHGLVSAFTAFVAVDSSRRTEGDHGTSVKVPVPVPEGVRYETTVPEKK